ncbi:hypothetical protein HYC85_003126 [Camellia sinensis]|uniref:Uncharacterized protein n=1 Tax=Camellia sinensis TaxID=4442 RepID=A0A7J7IBF6_CAMSI|nr:hypothetical protein HYC85_003126 [Camellia sinensis]
MERKRGGRMLTMRDRSTTRREKVKGISDEKIPLLVVPCSSKRIMERERDSRSR